MRKVSFGKRLISMLLALVMILGMAPVADISGWFTKAQAAEGETTYVLAGSDFQPTDYSTATGVNLLNQILNPIYDAGYTSFDGFLFAGDYDYGYSSSTAGKNALQGAVKEKYPDITHEVYVEGNHDCASRQGVDLVANGTLSPSGANDAENYGVYVIHERDYMWASNGINPTTIQDTATKLEAYLNAKRNAGYTKPIFVISHLPLHYSMRTKNDGDGSHANYIFDVLNEAGNAGLNIIFMFGHNHSNGWDDYLGGGAIYLAKGDKINIAQASRTVWQEETLAFTYMNAGYVSYYRNVNTGSETDLTMTVFEITDDKVEVKRFSKDGLHDVKSKGVTNSYKNESGYSPDTTVYESPQTITLNKEITPAGEEITPPSGGNTGSGTERTYTRVTSTSELVSDGKYLIFYNGSHFMLPEVVEKSDGSVRKGFNIESTSICGPDTITGDYTDKEWTLTSSGSGWLLGNGTQYAKLTNTSTYKVTATLENSGDVFTIGGSGNAFTFSNGTYVFNYNDRGLINGYASDAATFYIYRMTNEGSSGGSVDTTGGNWVTITDPVTGGKYRYVLDTDGIDTGVEYLIVANSYEKALSAAASSNNAVDIDISGNYAYATSDTYGWTFTRYDNGVYYIRLNGSTYLRVNNGSLGSSTSTGSTRRWTVTSNGDGSYDIVCSGYNLRWSNSNGVFQVSSSNEGPVRLYKYDGVTEAQAGLYGKVSGELTYNVATGTSAEDALALVKAGITGYTSNSNTATTGTELQDGQLTWTLDKSYNGTTAGEYAVTIAYNGVTLGVAKVVVPSVNITGYSVEPSEGTVNKGASQTAQTGALIYVQLENGKYYTVPVTVGMLTKADGSPVSTGEMGSYDKLTLTYNGVKITENFTLNVVAKTGNNYPEYPNEGAVKVNKTGTGIDFQSSGIAQVEISASGVPMKKGADVIVMLDLSSSMNSNSITVNGVTKTRLQVLRESMTVLLNQLQANDAEGNPMDIRIAVADFHRYYLDSSSPYYINSADHLTGGSIRDSVSGTNKVYTGDRGLNAGAFMDVHDITNTAFETTNSSNQYYLGYKSGTNYDYAFDAIYQLGEAITTQNATDGVERDLFVIFMSDGAPFQFNYFSAQSGSDSGSTQARYWNNWLQGTMTDAMFDSNARNDYYNEDGKHWMAEAIKGDPASTYPVIRKNNAADTDGDTWVNVNGLGAKMYSIGFCLEVDKEITVTSMDTVIKNIASSDEYYFRANSAADLNNAFTSIGGDIAYAAYNARFVDQMGDDYDLQLKTSTYDVVVRDENGNPVDNNGDGKADITTKTLAPVIEILTYDIYTKAEADAGQIPTGKNIGDRKGTFTLKEVVKFSDDGTKAYSNLIDKDKDGIYGVTVNADGTYTISDTDDNILDNGVISATTFLYNTNVTAVTVEGVSIPTGKDSANLTTGSTNVLPSETFYWKMGTVQTSELAMRYYVYLTGSMEGTREAGSYPTNEYATLYYDNYLHNPCYKETVSPVMAWKEANVSYAFYLVNENGEIIVNQTTGETGPFAKKVAVTNPVVYETILLNNNEDVSSIDIASLGVLPEGYTLYDYDGTNGAIYTVTINSNTTGSWNITSVKDKATTYVMQYDPNDPSVYSNERTHSKVGDDYTHTVVWFAVVWKVQALPDSVVVDYGLPVDISVLANDMFGDYGKLAGVGAYSDSLNLSGHDATLASDFGDTYKGTYGTAKADASTGKVRYTLETMEMNGYDKFAYAVNYTGNENAGYYYDTVTVIPATTIYYEEGFITFSGSNTEWKDAVENYDDSSYTQDEDRPGQYSLTDANNIYGYDSVNNGMSTYSLGNAKMVHVDANSYATASFTFYGTGFDVISMTSNTTGNIAVKVEDASGNAVAKKVVNTYYGYTQVDGQWVATPDTANSLYQVPVLQIENLPYGQYKVTITATYISATDKTSADGYDLYLDAIRIYDPANDGASDGSEDETIENAYAADGEGWPSYIELRNKIITAGSFDDIANDVLTTDMEGLVFIDGNPTVGNAQIADYVSYGPNNEVYLAQGQSIAFLLDTPANIKNVHIGMKSADGNPVVYNVFNVAQASNSETDVEAGDTYGAKTKEIDTTTDMYYDLTGWKNDIIVITNTGSGILSITNIKSTYTSNPNGTVTTNEGDDTNEVAQANETMVYMTAPAAMLTLRAVNTMYLPEAFEPEKLEVSLNKTQAKVGDKIHVTVTTSGDVEYITVNGEVFTAYKVNRRSGDRIWKTTVQADRAGEMNVDVVAYNAEDIASEAVSETVTVRAKQQPEVIIRDIIKGIIGKIFG